ncbi:MAG: InlB B-repeat-containing protein, partial [Clostridia bacterium]|nr:InlB B-repeat-containing protein [Clostridia bacterium]
MNAQTIPYGIATNLTANAFTREYTVSYNYHEATSGNSTPSAKATYTFKHWNSAADGNGTYTYANQASVTSIGNMTLYAQWNSASVTLPNPEKTGYTLEGWYTAASGGTKVGDGNGSYTPTANIQLHAQWTPITYTIQYNGNGGTGSVASQTKTYDTNLTLRTNSFTREGWHFLGWSQSSTATTETWGGGATLSSDLSTTPDATVTLYAVWARNTSKVTVWQYKDGTTLTNKLVDARQGDSGTTYVLTPGTRNGYTLDHWAFETASPNGSISGNTYTYGPAASTTPDVVYGVWTANNIKITLNHQSGTSNRDEFYYTYNTNAYFSDSAHNTAISSVPVPTRAGYTFGGYYTGTNGSDTQYVNASGDFVNNLYSDVYADTTLYAKWTENVIDVTLDNQSATTAGTGHVYYKYTISGYYSNSTATTSITSITVPTKTGYTFGGYYSEENGGGTQYINADGSFSTTHNLYSAYSANVTLYAKWTANTYTVKFNGNGHTSVADGYTNTQGFTYDVAQALRGNGYGRSYVITLDPNSGAVTPTEITASYTFDGWATSENGSVAYANGATVSNLATSGTYTLYAHWDASSAAKTLPTPTRDGYEFEGWHVGSVSGTKVTSPYTPTADVTLVANWTPIPYTVSYDTDGGNPLTGTSYNITQSVTLATPTKTGYTFVRWDVKTPAGNWLSSESFDTAHLNVAAGKWGNVELKAVWTPITYSIHFNGNGSTSGNTSNQTGVVYDQDTEVNTNGFTRTYKIDYVDNSYGHSLANQYTPRTFLGWGTSAGGSAVYRTGTDNETNKTVRNLASTQGATAELYAIWDEDLTTLYAPTETGYTLEGWYTDPGFDASTRVGSPNDTIVLTEDITVYARWVAQVYRVVYNGNGGTGTAPAANDPVNFGTSFTLAANTFTKTGYTFKGWTREGGEGGPWMPGSIAISTIVTNADSTQYGVWDDTLGRVVVNLYAKWEANTYTVTYHYNYEGAPEDATRNATYDSAWPTAPTYTRVGYTFGGWYDEATCTNETDMTDDYTIAGNKDVYAKWNPVPYTAHFDGNGGSNPNDVPFNTDTSLSLPASTRTGYTFKGWKVTAVADVSNWTLDLVYNETVTSVPAGKYGNVTFTAQWTPIEYTITFVNNGATTQQTYTIVSEGTLGTPERAGYTFGGWKASDATAPTAWNNGSTYGGNTSLTGKYGNVTLTAQWTPVPYTITYTDSVASGESAAGTKDYTPDSTDTLKTPAKVGYNFLNWKATATDATSAWTVDTTYAGGTSLTGKYGNVTLEAQWQAHTYTITFDKNAPDGVTVGGTNPDQNVTYDVAYTLNTNNYTALGYTFLGWSRNSGATAAEFGDEAHLTNELYTAVENVAQNVTLYAIWQRNASDLTLDLNGGTYTGTNPIHGLSGETVSLPTPTAPTGMVFVKWEAVGTLNGTLSSDGMSYTFATANAANDTVKAKYSNKTFTITYQYGENPDATKDQTVSGNYFSTGLSHLTAAAFPTNPGYTLKGWAATVGGTTIAYTLGAAINPTAFCGENAHTDTTLYAIWEINRSELTVNPNGGTWNGSTAETTLENEYNTEITVADPTRTGYTFAGWDTTGIHNGSFNASTRKYVYGTVSMADAGYTADELVAQWNANSYSVVYHGEGTDIYTQNGGKYDTELTLYAGTAITKTGWTLVGWSKTEGGAKDYNLSAELTIAQANALYEAQVADMTAAQPHTVDLYAVWQQNESTVIVKNEPDGTVIFNETDKSGETLDITVDTKTGHKFVKWVWESASHNGSLADDESQSTTYTFGNAANETDTLWATWTPIQYGIHFDGNAPVAGGTVNNVPGSITKTWGVATAAIGSTVPTFTGWTFAGWSDGTNDPYAYNAVIDTDYFNFVTDANFDSGKTLVAQWTRNTSTLHLDLNGGSGITTTDITQDSGTTYAVPTPTAPTGMVFTGWTAVGTPNGSFDGTTYTFPQDNGLEDTLQAQYEYKTYTITYQYGSTADATKDKTISGAYNETKNHYGAADFTKIGYTLKGWAASLTDANNGTVTYTLGATIDVDVFCGANAHTDTTLYAVWEINRSELKVDPNGGTWNGSANETTVENEYGFEYTVADPTRTGYTFNGWNDSGIHNGTFSESTRKYVYGAVSKEAEGYTADTLTAKWNANIFTVVYHGEGTATHTQTGGVYDAELTLYDGALLTKTGYTLVGWSKTEGGAKAYDLSAALTAAQANALYEEKVSDQSAAQPHTIDLYAVWERNTSKVHVFQYKLNGVLTNELVEVTPGNSGDTMELDPETRTGYTFDHWEIDTDPATGSISGNIYTFGNASSITPDDVYGVWNAHHYNINYKANDGQSSDKLFPNYVYDEYVTLAAEDLFTRTGYEIVRWWTAYDETNGLNGTSYTPGQDVMNLTSVDGATVDLYAEWQVKDFTVTLAPETGYEDGYSVSPAALVQTIYYQNSVAYEITLADGYTDTTVADLNPTVTAGSASVTGVKNGNVITLTVTCLNEGDITVTLGKAKKNTYTVTLVHENGSFNSAVNGYDRPEVQATVTHGENVAFSVALAAAYSESPSVLVGVTPAGAYESVQSTERWSYVVENVTGNITITLKDAVINRNTVEFKVNPNEGSFGVDGENNPILQVSETGNAGTTYTVTEPTRTGYDFAGWQADENNAAANGSLAGNTYTFGNGTGTNTYVATWTPKTYTVTLTKTAGPEAWATISEIGTQQVTATYGENLASITAPVKVGYDFLGYTLTEGGTDYRYQNGAWTADYTPFTGIANVELFAKWQKHVYSVTGTVADHYTLGALSSKYYDDTYTFTVTADTGYDINDVTVDVTGSVSFSTSISGNVMTVTVTGVRDDNVITVTGGDLLDVYLSVVKGNNAFVGTPAPTAAKYGDTNVAISVTVEEGYYLDASCVAADPDSATFTVAQVGDTDEYTLTVTSAMESDVALTVTPQPKTYQAILVGAGTGLTVGDGTAKDIVYLTTVNGAFTLTLDAGYTQTTVADLAVTVENGTATLTKSGDTITVNVTSTAPGDVKVTIGDARENTYTVTLVNNAGATLTLDPVPESPKTVAYSGSYAVSFTVNAGYHLPEGNLLTADTGVTIVKSADGLSYTVSGFTADTVLTLAAAEPNASTLILVLGGGTLAGYTDGQEIPGVYTDTKTFGKPAKAGYTFLGWVLSDGANGSVTEGANQSVTYAYGTEAGARDTLTATWQANTYHIIYKYNTMTDTDDVVFGAENVTLRTTASFANANEGYTLTGWKDAANVVHELGDNVGTYTTVGDTVYEAVWTINTSTLHVDLNDGRLYGDTTWDNGDAEHPNARDFTQAYNTPKTINTPVHPGYDFTGWTFEKAEGNTSTFVGSTYTFGRVNGAEDKLTAGWQPKNYSIVYRYNVGTSTASYTQSVTFNEAVTLEGEVFTREGYTLLGWADAADAAAPDYAPNAAYTDHYTTVGDTVLYAVWQPIESTVEIYGDVTDTTPAATVTGNVDSEAVTLNQSFTKTGYHFTEWTIEHIDGAN